MNYNIKGSIPALITPFKNDKIDEESFIELIKWHISQGSHGLVIIGTTGESPTLSNQEFENLVKLANATIDKKIPLIVGTGSNNTEHTIEKSQLATKLGVDALLISSPYYNKPSQAGLLNHFTKISQEVNNNIILYNVPGRTACDISNDTILKLSQLNNIIGLKDATADLTRVSWLRRKCPTDFLLLSGDDATSLGFNAQGGNGSISVTANLFPKLSAQMQELCFTNDYEKALNIFNQLFDFHINLFCESNPVPVKYALSLLNKCSANVRQPLCELQENNKKLIESLIKKYNF